MKYKIKHLTKKSVFKQYIFTYILFFWVVISLFVGVLYSNVKNNMQQKWQVDQANKLLTIQYIIDSNFDQINLVAREVGQIESIKNLELQDQVVETIELQQKLRNIKQFAPMVEEIIVYLKGNKYIYSDLTTYTSETLKSVRGVELQQNIDQEGKPKLHMIDTLSQGMVEKNILVTYPFIVSRNKEIGTINLVVSGKAIRKIINQVISIQDKQFLILADNKLIWKLSGIEQQDLFYIQALVADKIKGELPITLEGEEYNLFYTTSPSTKFKYIYCVDNEENVYDISSINKAFGLISLLCIVLSGGIICLLTYYNYKPIKSIKKMINGMELNDIQDRDEFEMIEQTISQLNYKNVKLDSTLGKMMDEQERYLYYKLLRGSYHEKVEGIRMQLGSIELPAYRIINYSLAGAGDIEAKKQKLSYYIKQYLGERIIHIELGLEIRQVVCILNSEGVKEEILQKYHEELQKMYIKNEEGITMVIGTMYYNWEDISSAFKETQRMLEYRTLGDTSQIIWQEKWVVNQDVIQIPNRLLAKLKLDINKADRDSIKVDLESLEKFMREEDITYKAAQSICSRVMSEVLGSLDEEVKSQIGVGSRLPTTSEIKEVNSIDEVSLVLKRICEVTYEAIEVIRNQDIGGNEEKSDLYMHAMRYIKKNYMNSDLSIQEIADKNNMALPNLTNYFKKQVGQTPKDYLTHIRMKHAKELLITTKESLSSIANQSGYQNVSSFIRQFKKVEGITPGEYRKLNTKS